MGYDMQYKVINSESVSREESSGLFKVFNFVKLFKLQGIYVEL